MKKTITGSLILLGLGLAGVTYYISNSSESSAVSTDKKAPQAPLEKIKSNIALSEEVETTQKMEIKQTVQPSGDELEINTNQAKIDKNKIYEDALRSVVDKESLQASQDEVFNQYKNDIFTSQSNAVRNVFYDKIYSSNTYDSLLAKNIRFTDVACKKTLCKVDFELPKDNSTSGFEIPSTLINNKLIRLSHGANFYSKESDGNIHFYISTDAVNN